MLPPRRSLRSMPPAEPYTETTSLDFILNPFKLFFTASVVHVTPILEIRRQSPTIFVRAAEKRVACHARSSKHIVVVRDAGEHTARPFPVRWRTDEGASSLARVLLPHSDRLRFAATLLLDARMRVRTKHLVTLASLLPYVYVEDRLRDDIRTLPLQLFLR